MGRNPKKPRQLRARDMGDVVPLGVEILASIYDTLQECRKAKKWTKRSAVEEALRVWLTAEGFPPPPAKD